MSSDFVDQVREKANKRILFLPHAISQMNRPERMISTAEVRHVVFEGEIMECYYCKGNLVRSTSSYYVKRDNYHLVIESVPAWVCEQCGEIYFSPEVLERMDAVLMEGGMEVMRP